MQNRFFRQIFITRTRILGKDHPQTLDAADNLSYVLYNNRKYSEAKELSESALKGRERFMGAEHPDTLKSVNNYAKYMRNLGQHKDAAALYNRAYLGYLSKLGLDHPNTLHTMRNLAIVYADLEYYEKAEKLLSQSFTTHKKLFGEDQPSTVSILNDLLHLIDSITNSAAMSRCIGENKNAQLLYRQALEIMFRTSVLSNNLGTSLIASTNNYIRFLKNLGWERTQIIAELKDISPNLSINNSF